jgi:hypothetical protein
MAIQYALAVPGETGISVTDATGIAVRSDRNTQLLSMVLLWLITQPFEQLTQGHYVQLLSKHTKEQIETMKETGCQIQDLLFAEAEFEEQRNKAKKEIMEVNWEMLILPYDRSSKQCGLFTQQGDDPRNGAAEPFQSRSPRAC